MDEMTTTDRDPVRAQPALPELAVEVRSSRERYLRAVEDLSREQSRFKPALDVWSPAEITEHLVHAEQAALESGQLLLERRKDQLEGADLESVIHPHPISGPLDMAQRFEFLRFHLDRHRGQVERLRRDPAIPG